MFVRDFLQSLGSFGKALEISSRFGLWRYWAVPGLLGVVLGAVLFGATWQFGATLGDLLVGWYSFDVGSDFVQRAGPWLGRVFTLLFTLVVFKYLLLIALSPFLSILSERVEQRLSGEQHKSQFSLSRALSEMLRGIRLSLRNIIRELVLVLALSLLSLLGPLSLIAGPLIFIVQAYYAGFGNFDFALERHYRMSDSVSFVRQARGSAIANGAVFLVLIATVIGVFVAPTWATIAGTIEVRRLQSEGTNL